jgi:hypothetical protein
MGCGGSVQRPRAKWSPLRSDASGPADSSDLQQVLARREAEAQAAAAMASTAQRLREEHGLGLVQSVLDAAAPPNEQTRCGVACLVEDSRWQRAAKHAAAVRRESNMSSGWFGMTLKKDGPTITW